MEALQFPTLRLKKRTALLQIPIEKIRPNPYLPRKYFHQGTLTALAASIEIYGILEPVLVRQMNGGFYELIAGARRVKAAQLAGLSSVPALVLSAGEAESAILACIENIHRDALSVPEEAEGCQTLLEDYGMTEEEIAACLACTEQYVADRLRLLRLEPPLQKQFLEKGFSADHAKALLRLPDTESRMEVFARMAEEHLDVKATERLVEETLKQLRYRLPKINKQKEKQFVQDFRLYTNTLRQAVALIAQTGAEISYTEAETAQTYEMTIHIDKIQDKKDTSIN